MGNSKVIANKWAGQPPFGFNVGAEGYLSPNDDYKRTLVIIMPDVQNQTSDLHSHYPVGSNR